MRFSPLFESSVPLDPADMYSMMGAARAASTYAPQTIVQKTLAGRVREFVGSAKVTVDILLENEKPHNTYTTMDRLEGIVSISSPQNVKFDILEIQFLGQVYTLVERLGTSMHSTRNEAHHQFLKLVQPISNSALPENNTLEAGQTYKFPFTFCIPEYLLPSACRHTVLHDRVKDSHLQLPPTLNDPDVFPPGVKGLDELAPDMVRISYGIRIRLLSVREGKETLVAEKHKKLRIVPAMKEQPRLEIDPKDNEYCLRKEKSVRKGMFKSRLGRVVMEAVQPKPFCLTPSDLFSGTPPSIMATVLLRFDPSEPTAQPPRLGSLTSKLKSTTYFSTTVLRDYPTKATLMYDPTRSHHIETLSLSSRNMGSVQWHRQEADTDPANVLFRRDSAASIMSTTCPEQSSGYSSGSPFWVAELLVPITLPVDKFFVPTFHTCLISRQYLLEVQLSVPTPAGGAKGVPTTLTLRLPVQIAADRVHAASSPTSIANEELMAYYEAQVQEAMEQGDEYFFGPRSGDAPPLDEYVDAVAISPSSPSRLEPMFRPRLSSVYQSRGTIMSSGESESEGEDAPTPMSPGGSRSREQQDDDLPPDYSYHAPRGSVAVAS